MKFLKYFLLAVVLLAIVGAIASFVVVKQMLQPVNPASTEKVSFVVPKGAAVLTIGQSLTDAGLIKNPWVFRILVQKDKKVNAIQAGTYMLSASMTPSQLIAAMSTGTDDVTMKLLEGWRREEMAEAIGKLELPNFDEDEFLTLTDGQEGYLFPDTYRVQKSVDTQEVVDLLTSTYDKKVKAGLSDEIEASGRPLEENMVLASLVQREAKGAEQMRTVAGVLVNRLNIDMALNVDASLQYVKGYDKVQQAWWTPPLAVDKERVSPFNTYMNAGLPPRPICNPGLDAIKAALTPSKTAYLYYLHDPQGVIHFAETLPEHNANVQKYLR